VIATSGQENHLALDYSVKLIDKKQPNLARNCPDLAKSANRMLGRRD